MKIAGLKCDVCGATASQSGKPFTPAGLGAHKAHLHGGIKSSPVRPPDSASPEALLCDICGAAHNARGVEFQTDKDIAQHKRRIHGISAKDSAKKATGDNSKTEKRRKAPPIDANHVKFCPRCGFNMEIVNAAMALITGN